MIQPISLSKFANAARGQLVGDNVQFSSVAIDTRSLVDGDLYIALKGEHFDGHHFVEDAIRKGCSALVVERDLGTVINKTPYVIVNNTLHALGDCARLNRESFKGKVVGLTGSSGKTSTKNMLESILSEKGATYATPGNFNNEIGVPLTLLAIDNSHEYAVVEMGARKEGDIKYLINFVQPDVAILLNAGTSHIDVFGSQESIVRTKGEIFTSLKKTGLAVLNADDPSKEQWLKSLKNKQVLTFSVERESADVFATDIEIGDAESQFTLNYHREGQRITLPVPGIHNISNSLAASAAAIHLGLDLPIIANGLAKLRAVTGRLKAVPCSETLVVIDDSYNANLSSMKAAIDVLALRSDRKIAVLGEMVELGDFSKKLHLELAEYIAHSNIDRVYLIGPFAVDMANLIGDKARAAESKNAVFSLLLNNDEIFETNDEALKTSVLIKGSRSTAMDELVDMIVKKAAH